PGDLLRRLAPGRDTEENRALLRLGRLPVHEVSKRGLGEIARERAASHDDAQGLGHVRGHGAVPWRRKFSRSRSPSGVRTDSGWNWTPKTGLPRTASPMTRPSSVRAVTARSPGRLSSRTIREWYRPAGNGLGRPAKSPVPSWRTGELLPWRGA